jgi:hypothetical protein
MTTMTTNDEIVLHGRGRTRGEDDIVLYSICVFYPGWFGVGGEDARGR